jgi:chemotaxis protein histidine kinase CheA
MNKGNISVKSKVGKGSTFVLEFPLGKEIISEN